MSEATFQFLGENSAGTISAHLKFTASGEIVDLQKAVALTLQGECDLVIDAEGYPQLRQPLEIDLNAEPPQAKAKGQGERSKVDDKLISALTLSRVCTKDPSSGEQSEFLFLVRCELGHSREMLLVNAKANREGETDYRKVADTRRRDQTKKSYQTLKQAADKYSIATHFDYDKGQRLCMMPCSPSEWMVVNRTTIAKPALQDVYDWVEERSQEAPGGIVELAIFAHLGANGPLMGTDQEACIEDFQPRNMDVSAFGRAFAGDAQCYFSGGQEDELLQWCATIVDKPRPENPRKRFRHGDLCYTWDSCLELLRSSYNLSYAQALARATGVVCWSTSPGTVAIAVEHSGRDYLAADLKAQLEMIDSMKRVNSLQGLPSGFIEYTGRDLDTQNLGTPFEDENQIEPQIIPVGALQNESQTIIAYDLKRDHNGWVAGVLDWLQKEPRPNLELVDMCELDAAQLFADLLEKSKKRPIGAIYLVAHSDWWQELGASSLDADYVADFQSQLSDMNFADSGGAWVLCGCSAGGDVKTMVALAKATGQPVVGATQTVAFTDTENIVIYEGIWQRVHPDGRVDWLHSRDMPQSVEEVRNRSAATTQQADELLLGGEPVPPKPAEVPQVPDVDIPPPE